MLVILLSLLLVFDRGVMVFVMMAGLTMIMSVLLLCMCMLPLLWTTLVLLTVLLT